MKQLGRVFAVGALQGVAAGLGAGLLLRQLGIEEVRLDLAGLWHALAELRR